MTARTRTGAGLGRSALVAGVALALGLGTSACTTFDGGVDWEIGDELGGTSTAPADEVVVDAADGSVDLVVGQSLVVDFGEINSSVGDEWVLTQDPDDDVLSAGDPESEYLGEDGTDGGSNTLVYRFQALAEGESTLDFEYRFRGGAADFGHGPEPVSITVTVTG